jgi:hypothetical protein
MSSARKVFSFARMMVLAQRRHDERMARLHAPQAEPVPREHAFQRTLQKMNGTKRLVVFMNPA